MRNETLVSLLNQIASISDKKSDDYASAGPYENFNRSADLASWFNDKHDKVFATFIATKIARLATLLNSGEAPNNESIDDSFLDLTTYCALWASFRKDKANPKGINYAKIEEVTVRESK